MKNSRLYLFIVAILVLLNLSCLYFLWKSGTIGNGRDSKFRIENYLTQELKFDHAQQDKFAELRTDHREKVKTIKDKNRKFHENYFDQLKSISIDSQAYPYLARRRNIARDLRHGIGRIGHLQAAA